MHYLKSLLSVALCYFLALGSTACRTTTSVSETKEVDPEEWLEEVPTYDVKSRKIVADFGNSFMTKYLEEGQNLVLFDKASGSITPLSMKDIQKTRNLPKGKEIFIGSEKSRYFLSLKPAPDFYQRLRKNELKMIVHQHDRQKAFEQVDYSVIKLDLSGVKDQKSLSQLTGATFRKITSLMNNVQLDALRANNDYKIKALKDEIARRTAADAKETKRVIKESEAEADKYAFFNGFVDGHPIGQLMGTFFFMIASGTLISIAAGVLEASAGGATVLVNRIVFAMVAIAIVGWIAFLAYDYYMSGRRAEANYRKLTYEKGWHDEFKQIEALKKQLEDLVAEQGVFFAK